MRDYGSFIDSLKRGEEIAISDVRLDERTAEAAAALEGRSARSFVNVPVRERGGLVAVFFISHAEVRDWSPDDLALIHEVATRMRTAVERAQSQAALRDLNETLETRVAQALAERQVLADVVESTAASIPAFDLGYRILAISKAAAAEIERAYGTRPQVGDNLLDLIASMPDHRAQVARHSDRALAGEEFMIVEEFGDAAHERVTCEVRFTTLRDRDGQQVGAFQTAIDVTDRVPAQADLKAAQDAPRQSRKTEAVGQLTGGLAHDFNNLLAGISGSLELLAARIGQGRVGDVDRDLVAAQGAARRASALTHRLLAFSRRQTLAPKVTDANAPGAGMEELIRRTVGPQVAMESVLDRHMWPIEVDLNQLENALLNLCLNSRDAMPDGGTITIETATRTMDPRAAREQEPSPGDYVTLSVRDSGTGMPADVVGRAFDPFFTTKPLGVGTGLGLSMVHGVARQSGGQVRITSEVGQGTTVCRHLPRHLGGVEQDSRLDAELATAAGSGSTVLVIDDEPVVRMPVVDVLEELGCSALEAGTGPEGLEMLESKARVDLLITDVGLPGGLNGRQVADAARVLRPGVRVLFITGYAEAAVIGQGQLEPGMHVLTEPFAVEELGRRIKTILAGDGAV